VLAAEPHHACTVFPSGLPDCGTVFYHFITFTDFLIFLNTLLLVNVMPICQLTTIKPFAHQNLTVAGWGSWENDLIQETNNSVLPFEDDSSNTNIDFAANVSGGCMVSWSFVLRIGKIWYYSEYEISTVSRKKSYTICEIDRF
jgi:hypothetical protein